MLDEPFPFQTHKMFPVVYLMKINTLLSSFFKKADQLHRNHMKVAYSPVIQTTANK